MAMLNNQMVVDMVGDNLLSGKRQQKTMVQDPPFYSWENSRFQLGHGFNSYVKLLEGKTECPGW